MLITMAVVRRLYGFEETKILFEFNANIVEYVLHRFHVKPLILFVSDTAHRLPHHRSTTNACTACALFSIPWVLEFPRAPYRCSVFFRQIIWAQVCSLVQYMPFPNAVLLVFRLIVLVFERTVGSLGALLLLWFESLSPCKRLLLFIQRWEHSTLWKWHNRKRKKVQCMFSYSVAITNCGFVMFRGFVGRICVN